MDSLARSPARVAFTALLAACPRLSFAEAPVYFDLAGAILLVFGWVVGLVILAITSFRPRARLARRLLLGWVLTPVVLFAGTLAWVSAEDRYNSWKADEFAQRFQQFCKEREQPFVNARAVVAMSTPAVILVTQGRQHGLPVVQTLAEATPCGEARVREFQYRWTLDGKEMLGRFGTCPFKHYDLERKQPDAEFELVVGRTYDEVTLPNYWQASMYAFSAEIRNIRTGDLLASRTLCSSNPNTVAVANLGVGVEFGMARLLADAFPPQLSNQGAERK